MSEGFIGCVQYLKINNQVLNISLPSNDVKNGLGIEECSEKKCLKRLCLNGGRCRITNDENNQGKARAECVCSKNTKGASCETQLNSCLDSAPCGQSNFCVPTSNGSFQCVCSENTDGKLCKNNATLKSPYTASFVGSSFIERQGLGSSLTSIDIIFYSQKPDAFLFYNGNKKDRDQFFGIKIKQFYLVLVVSLNGIVEEIV